jgi:oligo-1,6-glucosidase
MADNTYNNYDAMTVGETPFLDIDEALKFVAEDRKEFSMVIPFEHVELDRKEGWAEINDLNLKELKDLMSEWQYKLEENNGWTSLYFCNHDQPRIVSRYGDDGEYRKESAKMLGTLLHTLKGTPFIYQGEEIGMTNLDFDDLNDFDDIETRGYINDLKEDGNFSEEELLKIANYRSRDNARTPMHWNDSEYAGFSEKTPWIKMNDNYPEINVKKDLKSEDSVFDYYKKLISLRREYPVFVYGKYRLLLEEAQDVYAYLREGKDDNLLVLLNFSSQEVNIDLNKELDIIEELNLSNAELILSNYRDDKEFSLKLKLKPFEADIYKC